ncbi:small heat shock protein (HSP20) family protein [Pleurotus pulmonarius]
MDKDKAPEGGAFELLSWTTPAQFHFIVDRYNGFVEIARDDGEQAKFWKALEDDWSSVWDLTPDITQKLKKYYYTMHAANIKRGLLPESRLLPSRSQSSTSVLTNISQMGDANVNEPARSLLLLSPDQSTSRRINEYRPSRLNSTSKLGESNSNGDDTGNRILIDVPGFARSEIRATLAAGDLLVRAEKNVTKGKGKENTFDDPLLPSKPLDEKVELPLGIQHADIRAKLDGGRLTFQMLRNTTHRTHIVVEEIED